MTTTFAFKENLKNSSPVWFMRQAGRYHQHYKTIRAKHSFMEMCKNPQLACEVTLGPIEDFKFDAAILFSDLLFPLEHLNLGLDYDSGPPKIHRPIHHLSSFEKMLPIEDGKKFYYFQEEACRLLKEQLPPSKTLLGFIGGPWTLFTYATQGTHEGQLHLAKSFLYNDFFEKFWEQLRPSLQYSLQAQAEGGADALCIFDTSAGDLCPYDYKTFIVPKLKEIFCWFKQHYPHKGLVYYSKLTTLDHFEQFPFEWIDVLGVDWRHNIASVLSHLPSHLKIQGNIDPSWLHFPHETFKKCLKNYIDQLKKQNFAFDRWVAGLGHGVTLGTPEQNVRFAVDYIQTTTSN